MSEAEPNGLERRADDFGQIVREILRQFQSVHAAMAGGPHFDLSHHELRLVEHLGQEGPQMMRALAELLGLAVNSLTTIVDHLESKGLVTRLRSAEDRRVVRVQLTETGTSAYASARRAKHDFHRGLLANLTEDEQEILLVLFRKIARAGWKQVAKLQEATAT